MFADLVKSVTEKVRGKSFTFYEIGSQDWIDHVITESVEPSELSNKERAALNRSFGVKAVACSLAPGLGEENETRSATIERLIADLRPLPDTVIDELFGHVDGLNGILPKVDPDAGKAIRGDALPES